MKTSSPPCSESGTVIDPYDSRNSEGLSLT